MHYVSTRGGEERFSSAEAIARGLAPNGGLLLPEVTPRLPRHALEILRDMTYQQRAVYVMDLFLEDYTTSELSRYAGEAYCSGGFEDDAPAPLHPLSDRTWALELWHGPTCAFKDLALQMLPHLLTGALAKQDEKRTACILTATSGDTGKAALEGFRDVEGTRILVFYPHSGVSAVQELQMTTQQGENVGVCAVQGNFDDAQSAVKKLFSDEKLRATLDERGYFFSSANSINWGRVLPQIVYYVSAYCDLLRSGAIEPGESVNVCVPTGNFGNILSAYYAREIGVPIGKLLCASNRNDVLTDFLRTGTYDRNRPFYQTSSPSMDILISSNLERLLYLLTGGDGEEVRGYMESLAATGRYTVSDALREKLTGLFWAGSCGEDGTQAEIARMWNEEGYLIDPHSAVAFDVMRRYRAGTGDTAPVLVASTASPFKFSETVLRALGEKNVPSGFEAFDLLAERTGRPAPAPLAALREREVRFTGSAAPDDLERVVLSFLH